MGDTKNLAVVLAMFAISTLASASDAWDAYKKVLSNYYFFDNQQVETVSCHVSISTLSPSTLRELLKPAEKFLKIEEHLDEFKVIYSRKDGISFVRPRLEISIASTEGVSDRQQMERGLQMIKDGVRMQVDGAEQVLRETLKEFVYPKKDDLKDLDVSSNGTETIVKYAKGDAVLVQTYSGTRTTSVYKSAAMQMDSTEEYEDLNGKLALRSMNARLKQAGSRIEMAMTLKYQDLGSVFFPSVFDQQVQMSSESIEQKGHLVLTLTACKAQ